MTETATEARLLSKGRRYAAKFRTRMLDELAVCLGTERDALPPVFLTDRPKALKIGIYDEMIARFPSADPAALNLWLRRWCGMFAYVARVAHGLNRHDLDGNDCGEIGAEHRAQAQALLKKLAAKVREGAG
jgi:sRNA-binding protein